MVVVDGGGEVVDGGGEAVGDFWGEAEWMAVMRALVYKNYKAWDIGIEQNISQQSKAAQSRVYTSNSP